MNDLDAWPWRRCSRPEALIARAKNAWAAGALVLAGLLVSAAPASAAGSVTVAADTTGKTDATQAFVSAISQLSTLGGGTLVVPPGTYLVRPDVLNVPGNVTISGTGATLLASGTGYTLLWVSGTNIEVDGLTADGANQVVHLVEIGPGTSNLTLRGVTVQNAGQPSAATDPNYLQTVVGIRVEGDGHTMLFDGVTVRNIVATHPDTSIPPSLPARGLLLDNSGGAKTVSKGVTVQNSTFYEVGPKDDGDCLVIQGSSDTDAGLLITNNTFDRCHKRAIKLQVGGARVERNTIKNPFFGDNVYQVPGKEVGPNNTPTFDMFSGIALHSSNMIVSDNTLGGTGSTGSFYQGIEIAQAAGVAPVQSLTIQRNSISNGPGSLTAAPSSLIRSESSIAGLSIISNALTNAPYGLTFKQPISGSTITCNTYVSVASQNWNGTGAEEPCNSLDQYQTAASTSTSGTFAQGANASQISAQTFRAGLSGALTRASVYVWIQNVCTTVDPFSCPAIGPGDLIAQIRTVDATGTPTDTILSSASVPQASVGTYPPAATWIDLTFASPAQVSAGTTYALALTSASAGGMYYWGLVSTGDPSVVSTAYRSGQAGAKTACCGWSLEPYMDLMFKTYVTPSAPIQTNNPLPTLSTIGPMSAQKGGSGFPLTVTGKDFITRSTVRWNGVDLPTTPDPLTPTTKLSATVPAGDLATAGTTEISVFNPTPGGGTSNVLDFFVTDTGATVDASTSTAGFAPVQLTSNTAAGGTTTVTATPSAGNGTLTLAHYVADPVAAPAPLSSANYYDVHVTPGSSYTALNLVFCNGGNLVFWWDSTANRWTQVSAQKPDPQQPGCVDVSLTPQSSPNVTQLAGTPFAVLLDKTPPVTNATVAGRLGTGGWYVGPVTLTLNATDDLGQVHSTSYSTDGGVTWQSYSAPVAFTKDGSYAVQFRSTDSAGNVEAAKTVAIQIDQTVPTVSYTGNAGSYTVDRSVSITCTATDPPDANGTAGSGLAWSTCQDINGPAYSFAVGTNTFSASATDKAGNVGQATTSFKVQVTYGSLCTLTTRFVQGSASYQALPPGDRAEADLAATMLCQQLSSAQFMLTLTQKAQLITAYQLGVSTLVPQGWLTQAQATILINLSKGL